MKKFSSNIGKKEVTLANKMVTSTEKRLYFWGGTDMIIFMHEYVYKYVMVISNWINEWFSYINDINSYICL